MAPHARHHGDPAGLQSHEGMARGGSKLRWPYILVGSLLAFLVFSIIVIYVIIKTRRRKASSPLTPDIPKQAQINIPAPPVLIHMAPMPQQVTQDFRLDLSPAPSPPQPARKPKGLLERRGSNASLTIDLNPVEGVACGTPPKECSAEEYLSSAGNRLTRKQLRLALKDKRGLHQEFLDVPLNHPGKLDVVGSSNKNRYKSIWPNEASRVLLSGKNSYINANYIKGYDGEPRAFIATQGPLPNTINDFWRMVVEKRAPCVVMITKLKERNKIKCEPYLPQKMCEYGDVSVTVRSTTSKNGYDVRDLIIRRLSNTPSTPSPLTTSCFTTPAAAGGSYPYSNPPSTTPSGFPGPPSRHLPNSSAAAGTGPPLLPFYPSNYGSMAKSPPMGDPGTSIQAFTTVGVSGAIPGAGSPVTTTTKIIGSTNGGTVAANPGGTVAETSFTNNFSNCNSLGNHTGSGGDCNSKGGDAALTFQLPPLPKSAICRTDNAAGSEGGSDGAGDSKFDVEKEDLFSFSSQSIKKTTELDRQSLLHRKSSLHQRKLSNNKLHLGFSLPPTEGGSARVTSSSLMSPLFGGEVPLVPPPSPLTKAPPSANPFSVPSPVPRPTSTYRPSASRSLSINRNPLPPTAQSTHDPGGVNSGQVALPATWQVKHYWFTAWPDHKAPHGTAKQMLDLIQEVEAERVRRKHNANGTPVGPIVVHCSAGIGRTGCFIGTNIGMKQMMEENMVDVLGIVCQMRLDRGGMIQSLEQYEFLHHALIQYEKVLPETPQSATGLPPSSGSAGSNSSHRSQSNSSAKGSAAGSLNSSKQSSPVF